MRALIVLECLVVLALSALIVFGAGPAAPPADAFQLSRMLLDAVPGETALYRVDEARGSLEFQVLAADRGGPTGPPRVSITRTYRDAEGAVVPEVEPTYTHLFHRHGFLPFMTPEDAGAHDRVWVVKRVQRATIPWQGRELKCWKVEAIDPALPPDREAVEIWMHEDAPVYGILRWQRAGHVYELASWRPRP